MQITQSYLGMSLGKMRYLFFVLYEDYVDEQSQFVRELALELERFARNLGAAGAVVRPFSGDIEKTKTHVFDKQWSTAARRELQSTPALLVIDTDFDKFDPRDHSYFILNFGRRKSVGIAGAYAFRETLSALAKAANEPATNIFEVARREVNQIRGSDVARVFEARPGIFGFSVDLVHGFELLRKLYQQHDSDAG